MGSWSLSSSGQDIVFSCRRHGFDSRRGYIGTHFIPVSLLSYRRAEKHTHLYISTVISMHASIDASIYVHLCMYKQTYVYRIYNQMPYMSLYLQACMLLRIQVQIQEHTHTSIHTDMSICIDVSARIYLHRCAYIYTPTGACIKNIAHLHISAQIDSHVHICAIYKHRSIDRCHIYVRIDICAMHMYASTYRHMYVGMGIYKDLQQAQAYI